MTAKEVLKLFYADGWYEVDQDGSHKHLKHPTKPGKITVAVHSGKDIAPDILYPLAVSLSRRGLNKPLPVSHKERS